MFQASYTAKGLSGLLTEGGSKRKQVFEDLASSVGGKIESFYYAFGGSDLVVIADLPDDASAAAASITAGAGGAISITTTTLVSPETIDAAAAKNVTYRAPGT